MTSAGQLLARFGKFNLVGLLGAGLQLLLLYLFTKFFHMSAVTATPVVVEIVVLHNFAWHERFTWRDRRPTSLRQRATRLWRFHVGNGLTSLLGNTALAYLLVERLNVPVLPTAIAAIVICSLINFFFADGWVYDAGRSGTNRTRQAGIFNFLRLDIPGAINTESLGAGLLDWETPEDVCQMLPREIKLPVAIARHTDTGDTSAGSSVTLLTALSSAPSDSAETTSRA